LWWLGAFEPGGDGLVRALQQQGVWPTEAAGLEQEAGDLVEADGFDSLKLRLVRGRMKEDFLAS
jgi:hypothetical protein